MKIKVSDLKEFFKKSSKMQSAGVLPIYEYLLIEVTREGVQITKTNGNMYVKHIIEDDTQEPEKILVEEKRLKAFVANAKGEFVSFASKGKKLTITDGKITPVHLEAAKEIDVNAFKTFPESEGAERIVLNPEVVEALGIARNYAAIVDSNFYYVYAQVKPYGCFIYASNAHLIYVKKIEDELPEFAISPEVCAIISQFQFIQYYTAGNYDFFDTGNTVYGFIKTTYKAPEYMHIVRSVEGDESFTIDRHELLQVCELVNSFSVKEFPVLRFDDHEEGLRVHYSEDEYNANAENVLKVTKNFWPEPFVFNNAYLTQILKSFTTDEVVFTPGPKQQLFSVTHPEEKGLIILISPVMY